jgi:anti-sigma28 factor (negative regulator of flagellin synthesis)
MEFLQGDKSMKPLFRERPTSYQSRADRVSAIKREVDNGTYEIDSTNLANIMIIHLLNHSRQFQSSPLKHH